MIVPLRDCSPEACPTLSPSDPQSFWGCWMFTSFQRSCDLIGQARPAGRQGGSPYNSTGVKRRHQGVRGLAQGHSIRESGNEGEGALEVSSRPASSGYRQEAEPGAGRGLTQGHAGSLQQSRDGSPEMVPERPGLLPDEAQLRRHPRTSPPSSLHS